MICVRGLSKGFAPEWLVSLTPRRMKPLLGLTCALWATLALMPVFVSAALPTEPGTISVEDLLPRPLRLSVKQEAVIYYHATFDRALGQMAAGTPVTVVGLSDMGCRVRGRARHGDVAGWMKFSDLAMGDPKLPEKLKALYERQMRITELIAQHEVAIGMTRDEVDRSLGRPTRTSTKVTAAGREERLEYAIFQKVPQAAIGRAPNGQLVESVIYVKVEVGTLSVSFKNGVVEVIEETKGNPLAGAPVKIVPVPIMIY